MLTENRIIKCNFGNNVYIINQQCIDHTSHLLNNDRAKKTFYRHKTLFQICSAHDNTIENIALVIPPSSRLNFVQHMHNTILVQEKWLPSLPNQVEHQ